MMRAGAAMAGLALWLCAWACGPPPEPTFTNVQALVFTRSCAFSTCHGPFLPEQGMSLAEGQAYGAIVNVESQTNPGSFRVAPFEPDNSILYRALLEPVGPDLSRMPNDRPALEAQRIQLVRDWIEQGAQEN